MRADRQARHFGVLSFTGTGHLIPFLALAEELKRRGHRVTFFEKPKIAERVRRAGFEFVPITDASAAVRKAPAESASGLRSEIATLRFNLDRIREDVELFLRETPRLIHQRQIDALLINEIALAGPTVAELLDLPYYLISTSVPHVFGWRDSSWFLGYRYSQSPLSWLQGALLEVSALRMRGPIRRLIDRHRRQLGFGSVRSIMREYPPLAYITQLPSCLDLPPAMSAAKVVHTGPFADVVTRPAIPFPWEQLDGRPVVYASLGTTRNVQAFVLRMIAEACKDLDLQLILSLGNRFEPEAFQNLPGQPLVVKYAPQLEVLKISQLMITHGGANSVFEALLEGKPLIVIPLAYDQPAMAGRLARQHIAEVLPVMRLSAGFIRNAVRKVMNDRRYSNAAIRMQALMRPLRGAEEAARIIETSLDSVTLSRRVPQPQKDCDNCRDLAETRS